MNTSPSMRETIKKKIQRLLSIKKPWAWKAVKYTWIAFLVIVLGFPFYIFTVRINLFGLYGGMPLLTQVENPENDLSSELVSADGVSLGRFFRYNRSQVNYNQLSPELANTLVFSEDHRFQQHSGIDLPAYVRVIYGLLTLNSKGGGSTITQQLAKNLYTQNPDKSLDGFVADLGTYPKRLVEKTKEWMISINLEKYFTKEEIIAMYLNTSEFGNNTYGIKVAAETYFRKSPDSLNLQESAMLVGMLQAPSYYNPVKYPERAITKRNEVLRKILSHKFKIQTEEQYDSIAALPLGLDYKILNQNEGIATYFRTMLSGYLMEFCKERNIDLWNSGLKIYTTIDSKLQVYAEEAMQEHMAYYQKEFIKQWGNRNPWVDEHTKYEIKGFLEARIKNTDAYRNLVKRYGAGHDSIKIMLNMKKPMTVFSFKGERDTLFSSLDSLNYYKRFLQTGFMSMDPATGHIKAWVGGVNHKYFKFDHVRQSTRQAGSTFKPFVYGLAMELGYSPCYKLRDVSPSFKLPGAGGVWSPENALGGRGDGREMTIRHAMAESVNTITAQLLQALGPENVVDFAKMLGITTHLDPVPSLCLGTSDVSLFEMVGAYSAFVNHGMHTKPFFLSRIEDKNGNVIANFIPETHQATDEQTAYKMVYMLRGGVEEERGTSGGLGWDIRENNEIGGKTGTTDNASDGWYMGITHDLVSGVWVGGDERSIHFPSWGFGAGARSARPIWEKFMRKAYADPKSGITKGIFERPSSGVENFDCSSFREDSLRSVQKPIDIN
jgi:penicillin-binding protein 1A